MEHLANMMIGINRYIMECKFSRGREVWKSETGELIDTLWNVNQYVASGSTALCVELIDTLWNVNTPRNPHKFLTASGINRYIMECKSLSHKSTRPTRDRINRYIMECKYSLRNFI